MPVVSPVSERTTVACLLLLTFATGIVDAISVLALGHVFVANMTGNIIFLGFWFAPHTVVDMTAALVALVELRGRRGVWWTAGAAPRRRRPPMAHRGTRFRSGDAADALDPHRDGCDRLPRQHQADSGRRVGLDVRQPGRGRAPVRHTGVVHHSAHDDDRRHRLRQPPCRRHRAARETALQRGTDDVRGGVGRRRP